MTTAWLIRHGESESNAGRPSDTAGGSPLTELGERQADLVVDAFVRPPDLIVASTFVRARQTAMPTRARFPGVPYQEWQVEEFTYLGQVRGGTTHEERLPMAEAFWDRADPDFRHDDGESFADLFARANACVEGLAVSDGFVAMFTHGLFMRAVVWSMVTGIIRPTHEEIHRFRRFVETYTTPNGCIVELGLGGRRRVRAGSTAHLPAELVSGGF